MFFILSGFVLTRVYSKDFESGYSVSKYGRFLFLRLVRIYPLHISVLLAFAAIVVVLPGFAQRYDHPEYFSTSQFIATVFLVQNWRMGVISLWNLPSWSLSAEWLAYIAFPLAILVASSISWKLKPLAAVAVLLAMFGVYAVTAHADGNSAGIIGLIRMSGGFFTGCLLCQFVLDRRSTAAPWRMVTIVGTFLIAIGFLFPSLPILSYLGFAGIIAAAAATTGGASVILAAYPIVFLGEISFSLYLVHWPLIQIRNWTSDHVAMDTGLSSALLLPIIAVISVGTWYYIERPGREIGRRLIEIR